MERRTHQTTDGRYVQVGKGEWWDTTGIEIMPQAVVDEYMRLNPRVGIAIIDEAEESDAQPAPRDSSMSVIR